MLELRTWHMDIQIACAFSQLFFDMQTRFAQETRYGITKNGNTLDILGSDGFR